MKIISIVPGFGGTFYCGNCLRDSAYAVSLREAGHDAMTIPVYLPLTVDGTQFTDVPVFYGAVNIFLKQQFPLLENMPRWMQKFLNSMPVLKLAASMAGSTRATGLEELTESMLLGEDGRQAHELDELIVFLKEQKPDVVQFSNALLLGMAHRIKTETGAVVACTLQDEDVWVDAMHPDKRGRIWSLLSEKAESVDVFIAVSKWFAKVMQEKMSIPERKMRVVHIGIDPEKYKMNEPPPVPALGFLSRICHENGFHIVVDAFIILKKDPRFRNLRLIATGGMTGDDKKYLHTQIKKLKRAGIADDFFLYHNFNQDHLKEFFSNVSLVSVPVLHGEAFGLFMLECMASGIPVVQPALGAFPEVIEKAGGGITYDPNTAGALAEAVAKLLSDNSELQRLRILGRQGVSEVFNCRRLVVEMTNAFISAES